ncbi:MAG: N-ethylammeline chlorohydrolase, partial [Rhodospirillaceae bacterium]|nr:N-ethylammeline chlorohydrolase [Rhodospirillaceae bacterium]
MSATTVIRNAPWIVAYDEQTEGHKYIRDGDVALRGDRIIFIGERFDEPADHVVDGTDCLVMPGLLDLHLHGYQVSHGKGFFEDLASKHMWMTQLFEFTWLLQEDDESAVAAMQAA